MAAVLVTGCASKLKPTYTPASDTERGYFKDATLDKKPSEVALQIDRNRDKVYAWAGIVLDKTVKQGKRSEFEINLLVEHRDFNWQENLTGKESEVFILEPTSSGKIRVSGRFTRPKGSKSMPGKDMNKGSLVLVYGKPDKVEADGTLVLKTLFMRSIDRKWHSTRKATP